MDIQRINSYQDSRFSQTALLQHGCFLIDGEPYEVEILSDSEALLRGKNPAVYDALMDEFRFYAPHITTFRSAEGQLLKSFPPAQLLTLSLEQIQPSQFYADEEKVAAVATFLQKPEDVIIQVQPHQGRYISLDGHTRLYYAQSQGWTRVRAVIDTAGDYISGFVAEAKRRGIFSPKDLQLLSHRDYEEKWHRFCDDYFQRNKS